MGSLYGFEVFSELPLARLNAAAGTRGALRIEAATGPLEAPAAPPVSTLAGPEGRPVYASFELDGGACLLELPPTGSFLLEPGEGRVVVDDHGGDAEPLEHRIVSSAVCTLLALRGDLVLHASAAEVDGRAVLFCGPTRRGKSTLAKVLGEAGHRVLAEDGIAIAVAEDRAIAFPGARGVRVRSQDSNGQVQVDLASDPSSDEPQPCSVAAVVLLDERGANLDLEPLEPARALALLTPNLVHSGGRASIGDAFSRLATLLHSAPALRVALPDDLAALPGAAQSLLDSIALRS